MENGHGKFCQNRSLTTVSHDSAIVLRQMDLWALIMLITFWFGWMLWYLESVHNIWTVNKLQEAQRAMERQTVLHTHLNPQSKLRIHHIADWSHRHIQDGDGLATLLEKMTTEGQSD